MNGPDIPVRDKPLVKCWRELVELQGGLEWPQECKKCEHQRSCARCAAMYDIEDGKLKIKNEFCRNKIEVVEK